MFIIYHYLLYIIYHFLMQFPLLLLLLIVHLPLLGFKFNKGKDFHRFCSLMYILTVPKIIATA